MTNSDPTPIFDFDAIHNRCGSNCLKWDFAHKRGMPADVLPLWVADMDFPAPPAVLEALTARVQQGIFGYTDTLDDYAEALDTWFGTRHHWHPDPSWLVKMPGVVPALYLAVQAYTQPGDGVLIQSPVYYPFREAIHDTGRRVVSNPLTLKDGRYEIDFDHFAACVADSRTKLFILCSPHNPVGRVWTRDELRRMAELCLEHEVIIISDEIHMDFVYPPHKHTVFAQLDSNDASANKAGEYAQNALICTAPSKTFNIAGLQLANIFIPNEELRRRYLSCLRSLGFSQPNLMGVVACQAAYRGGAAWLDALLSYLQANFAYLRNGLQELDAGITLIEPEATYLAWLDCRALGLEAKALDHFMAHEAKLWLDGGTMFGPEGAGFQRVNLACPQATLQEALTRLTTALTIGV
jgi:cystathionine beta-lyase